MSLPIFDPTPFLGRDDDKRPIESRGRRHLRGRPLANSVGEAMTTLATLQSLIAQGESETLELKRSIADLERSSETLCH